MKSGITILYVDDEHANLMSFNVLFSEKYNIITGESGYVGLHLIEKNPCIDVIISDMKMPGMNGIEFIQKVKERYTKSHYYILTGYEKIPEIDNALRIGLIDNYFQKPFNFKEIESAITKRLNSPL